MGAEVVVTVDLTAGLATAITLDATIDLVFGLPPKREPRVVRGSDVATHVDYVPSSCCVGAARVAAGFFANRTFFAVRGIGTAGLATGAGTVLSFSV